MSDEKKLETETGKTVKETASKPLGKIAVVLVRGLVGVRMSVKRTLWLMGLKRVNQCVILEDNPTIRGMLKKVKDYTTFGPINDSSLKELVEKRAEQYNGRESDSKGKYQYSAFAFAGKKYKKTIRLNPPRKGYGRKGIKTPFSTGGALGDRGDKIADLIKRMI